MKIKKVFLILFFLVVAYTQLFAAIFQVKVAFKEYHSANDMFGAVRVKIENESALEKNGQLEISGGDMTTTMYISLNAGEIKVIDIPLISNRCSIMVRFGSEHENIFIDKESGKAFENGVLEIKIPGKGNLFFHNNTVDLNTESILERIELEELPTNLYCLFHYQIIVIPSEMESALTAEQFQLLKSYIGFGGKVMIIDEENKLPARWKNIGRESWGSVFAVKKESSINFDKILTEKNILDPGNGFFNLKYSSFVPPKSSKGIYLFIVLLFIICIGPLNYYLLKNRNKTFLIFFTSPLIAIIFSVLLIGVFFLKEGFYKNYEGISLTMVNPETNQALINLRHGIYSSNIYGKLERPRNGLYFPIDTRGSMVNQHQIEISDKAYLSGGFSKARTVNNFGEIRLVECNSKITLRYDDNTIYAKNHFGTKQKIMIMDTKNDTLYESVGEVEPDKEILMRPLNSRSSELVNIFLTIGSFKDIMHSFFKKLPHNMVYVAYAETNELVPFRAKDGFKQGQNLHLILGVVNQ